MLRDDFEYALISDVHLSEVIEPPEPGWWEYKSPASAQDRDLVGFLASLEARRPPAFKGTQVIFNGDTFDFDLVYARPDTVRAPKEGLPPTAPASVYKIERILDDHQPFVCALAGFLSRGNRIVLVMGNHDRELCFPEVQEVIRMRVAAKAPPGTGERVAAAIDFEPWFVHRPGVLYAEHGQQYDATCSYRDVLDPLVPADRHRPAEVETPFGSMMGRHMLCRLGTLNPFNDESFILSIGGYARHYVDHYWPRHSFLAAYTRATWRAVRELRWRRKRAVAMKVQSPAAYRAYAEAHGVDMGFIALLLRLASRPISDRLRLVLHELWVDRFFLFAGAIALLVVGLTLVKTIAQGLMLLALVPLLMLVGRVMGRGSLALQERARWGLVAEQIALAVRVPIVAFGHSHRPERRPLAGGGRYYNLGSWAPVVDSDRGSTLWRARRFLIVRTTPGGRVHVVFGQWDRDAQTTVG